MKTLLGFVAILIAFPLRGGDSRSSLHEGQLDALVAKKGSPLIYDEHVGEYQLVWTNHEADATIVVRVPLKFDPFTGRELGSRRDELFAKPSESESKEVFKKLKSCKGIEDVVKQFGKPDRVWPEDEHTRCTQYDFERCFKTLKLVIKVGEDGSLQPVVVGRQVKKSIIE
jgi:hypothetical protein